MIRIRLVLVMVVVAVLMIALWFTQLLGPEKSSYSSAKKDLAQLQQQRSELQSKVDMLSNLNKAKLKKGVEALTAAIPSGANLDTFFHNVQDAASQSGVTLTAVAPAPPAAAATSSAATGISPAPAGVTSISVTINLSGGYGQTSTFIDKLDTMPRLVIIDSLSVTFDSNSGNLDSQLAVRIFTTKTLVTTTTVAATATTVAK